MNLNIAELSPNQRYHLMTQTIIPHPDTPRLYQQLTLVYERMSGPRAGSAHLADLCPEDKTKIGMLDAFVQCMNSFCCCHLFWSNVSPTTFVLKPIIHYNNSGAFQESDRAGNGADEREEGV